MRNLFGVCFFFFAVIVIRIVFFAVICAPKRFAFHSEFRAVHLSSIAYLYCDRNRFIVHLHLTLKSLFNFIHRMICRSHPLHFMICFPSRLTKKPRSLLKIVTMSKHRKIIRKLHYFLNDRNDVLILKFLVWAMIEILVHLYFCSHHIYHDKKKNCFSFFIWTFKFMFNSIFASDRLYKWNTDYEFVVFYNNNKIMSTRIEYKRTLY